MSATEVTEELIKALGHEPSVEEKKAIVEEVKKRTGKGSRALVDKVLRRMPKPAEGITPTPVEPVVKVGEEAEITPPIEEEVTPPPPPGEEEKLEKVVERFEAGVLTSGDLTYVWQSVNSLFPPKHQRPDKAMEILGKLWVKPANRLIEKYAVENIDLYLAVGVTVLTFAPSIVGMIRERRKVEKPKVSEEIEK